MNYTRTILMGCAMFVAFAMSDRLGGEPSVPPPTTRGRRSQDNWLKPILGLQLWSLRAEMKQDVRAALDLVPKYGLSRVEIAGTGGMSPAAFRGLLDERGLVPVGAHYGYGRLQGDLQGVIAEAKILGVKYVICPALPRGIVREWNPTEISRFAADLNTWGRSLRAAGLRLACHTHGEEFAPADSGSPETLLNLLLRETDPEFVCFEMDVFWVVHAGRDPVELLARHPGRWHLMHVKDIRPGAITGLFTGRAPSTDNVPVGAGQMDWLRLLQAAHAAGVLYYFIEDESTAPLQNIPLSLSYLRNLDL